MSNAISKHTNALAQFPGYPSNKMGSGNGLGQSRRDLLLYYVRHNCHQWNSNLVNLILHYKLSYNPGFTLSFHMKHDYPLLVFCKVQRSSYYYRGTHMGSVLKAGDLNCSTINIVTWQHATCYKPFKLPSGHSENENIPQIWPVCTESALLYVNNLT